MSYVIPKTSAQQWHGVNKHSQIHQHLHVGVTWLEAPALLRDLQPGHPDWSPGMCFCETSVCPKSHTCPVRHGAGSESGGSARAARGCPGGSHLDTAPGSKQNQLPLLAHPTLRERPTPDCSLQNRSGLNESLPRPFGWKDSTSPPRPLASASGGSFFPSRAADLRTFSTRRPIRHRFETGRVSPAGANTGSASKRKTHFTCST